MSSGDFKIEKLSREQLAAQVYSACYLTGDFKLRSGKSSHEYFDKYRFEALPHLLSEVARQMAPLVPKGTEVLAGLEMGGIPIATALSLHTGIPAAFVRKKAKDYGTCLFAEGSEIKGKKVLIVEDVITTGGQVILSAKDLRESGAVVETVFCVIQREPSAAQILAAEGLKIQSLFTSEDLKQSK